MQREHTTGSSEETAVLGKEIAALVKTGGIVCLYGDLGSGKTTFTQGLAGALGIEKQVNSPTFLVIKSYELGSTPQGRFAKHEVLKNFYHIDLYRLNTEDEMKDIGIMEILDDEENIVVIEWSEKLGTLLPAKRIDIHFEYLDEKKRKIRIETNE